MSWPKVRAWRDRLRDHGPPEVWLSEAGAHEAWAVSLEALDDESLLAVERMALPRWERAAVVCAATVFTAPIEWLAVLLGRGSRVVLKVPTAEPGWGHALATAARACDLPLVATTNPADLLEAEYVVAMGSDASMASIAAALPPETRFEPHGHRFSVAWVSGHPLEADPWVPDDFADPYGSIAADAALHDGRGCLSPIAVFTAAPDAADRLAEAMARAELRWPRGRVSDLEHASIRARGALASVVGDVRSAASWSVHVLPGEHWEPIALPRSVALVQVANRAEAEALLAPHRDALSTVGTDASWPAGPRTCRLGRMQRPHLARLHDGVDWLRSTARPPK